jgi:hypothetical protein
MEWVRRIACAFGFHQYIPIREEWFMYRQKQLYIENQDYLKHGENITSVLLCPHCHKRIEIKVEK